MYFRGEERRQLALTHWLWVQSTVVRLWSPQRASLTMWPATSASSELRGSSNRSTALGRYSALQVKYRKYSQCGEYMGREWGGPMRECHLARAIRALCPPERLAPFSPTSERSPAGIL